MILNMAGIRQERPNKDPILNINKRLYRQSLNKKFDTHFESIEELEKIDSVSFLEIKLLTKNSRGK